MTLIDDLQALDLQGVIDARATITVTAEGPELTGVLSGDVGAGALGDLGTALEAVRAAAEDPEALLQAVVDALPDVGAIPGLEDIDFDEWERAVRTGAEIVGDLVAALGGDLDGVGRLISGAAGELADSSRIALDDYARVGVDELARLRRLVDSVDAGVPTSPAAFADLALDILLPFPRSEIARLRASVTGMLEGAAAIALPEGRVAGVLSAHDAVAAAARDGDVEAVRRALAALAQARDATIASLQDDARFAVERLGGLDAPGVLEAITRASAVLTGARTGVLEFLGQLRAEIAAARGAVESLDADAARAVIDEFMTAVDQRIQELLIEPVDERVRAAEQWVRELFGELPLRALRAELTELVQKGVAAIEEADLDGPAEAVRAQLREVQEQIAGLDVGAVVRAALEEIEGIISGALNTIVSALETIGEVVEDVAEAAQAIVEQAVEILTALADAVEEAKRAIEELPIEEAQQEVVDAIRALQDKAEELLAEVRLPEGLRPVIEQLTAELREVDLEGALLGPVDEALADFNVLEDLGLTDLVRDVQGVLSNLIPAQIATEVQAQLDAVLDGIRAFRPDRLRATVEGFLDEAADAIDAVDLEPVREVVHRPFAFLLEGFDQLKPSVLLKPLLDAYDDLIGAAGLGDPIASTQGLLTSATDAAAGMTRPLTDSVGRLAPGQIEQVAAQLPQPGADLPRPGDVVRLFGYLPGRLREALMALSAEARASALEAVDALVGGLGRDLRELQDGIWAVEARLTGDLDTLLAPLATAQVRSQLELDARFRAPGAQVDASLDVNAAFAVVASAGPAALREAVGGTFDLATGTVGDIARGVAGVGAAIEGAADALERSPLGQLGRDLDAFLEALDPEPLAAELDAFVDAAIARLPALLGELGDELERAVMRARQILLDNNPAVLLQRFLGVLDVVREELDLLNPHVLVAELDPLHDAARAVLEAYDPAGLVDEVESMLGAIAQAVRDIELDGFPGEAELADLGAAVQRAEDAVPAEALAGVGEALGAAGEALGAIDLVGLVDEIEGVRERVQTAMHAAVQTIEAELIALLEGLQYQQVSASASVSALGSVG